jgi:hypothetical protein
MSATIAGLIGVIAGAVVTGSMQFLIARADRREEARASARALHSLVLRSRADVDLLIRQKRWDADETEPDWTLFQSGWASFSDKLGRVIHADHYFVVVNYFLLIDQLGRTRSAALATDRPTMNKHHLESAEWVSKLAVQVNQILAGASKSWRERHGRSRLPEPPLRE